MNVIYIIALLVGALLYWLTRYQRNFAEPGKLMFGEYLRYEWPAFIWGLTGGAALWVLYAYLGDQIVLVLGRIWSAVEGVELPPFNFLFAFMFGFVGKVFIDRVPRVVNWFGANVRLPGAK